MLMKMNWISFLPQVSVSVNTEISFLLNDISFCLVDELTEGGLNPHGPSSDVDGLTNTKVIFLKAAADETDFR